MPDRVFFTRPERGDADHMYMAAIATALTMVLRAPKLDRELAAGANLRRDPVLQRRGARVTSRRRRDRLADGLTRLVEKAERGERPGYGARAPLAREEVLGARVELLDLAERLRSDAPVDPQGVLLLRQLLCDAASPAFTPSEPGMLRVVARKVRAALTPRP